MDCFLLLKLELTQRIFFPDMEVSFDSRVCLVFVGAQLLSEDLSLMQETMPVVAFIKVRKELSYKKYTF